MNRYKATLFLFFICCSFLSFSQVENETISLANVLKTIEKRFDIRFSYADKTVESIKLKSPSSSLNLEETLNFLQKETGLNFNKLSSRFISVEKIKSNTSSNIYQLQRLDEIVVQNYLTKGLAKTINGTTEISPQKFGILPGLIEPDILQTIQTLPGIISVDERISNINIRGGTNDQNLVLYEDIRMYQTGHFFGLISAFNPYLTEKVDVSVNGTKAKYGSGVSSTISINNADEIDTNTTSGVGTNLLSIDGFTKIQFSKKTELQLSARRSFTDALLTPTYDAYFERVFNNSELNTQNTSTRLTQDEQFYFYDINGKFLLDIDETSKLRANFITIFNRLDYNESALNTNNMEEGSVSRLSQKSYAGNLSYTKDWNASTKMTGQVYYSKYRLLANNLITNTTQELTQQNDVDDLGIRLDLLKAVDKNLNLNAGYQFNEVGVSNLEDVSIPRFRRFIKEVIKTHGIYGEAEFTSNTKNTYARIGLRGNYIEKFNTFLFEPRISLSQKFLNHFRLELLGEVKSQTITQLIDLQQDFFGIEKRRWQLADNENIPVTKSNQFSVGLNYKNNGWLLSTEGYIKNVMDITTRTQGFQNQFQFTNAIGSYNIKGLDVLINKQFKKLSTWLSYSYSKNDFKFKDLNNNASFPNNLDITHIINFSLAYEVDRLKIASGLNWHSGRPFTSPALTQNNSNRIIYNSPNAERLPDYMRIDISARYAFPVSDNVNAEVGVSVWNLLNQENIINRFYTKDNDGMVIQNDNTALNFIPNFSFRVNF